MLQTMILTIAVIPLALGVVAALVANAAGSRKAAAIAFLIPLFASAILIGIDGWPAFPPVRAAHKVPYVLAIGAVVFAVAALSVRKAHAGLTALAAAIAIALPAWWLGRNILANNSQKATVVAVLFVIAVVGVAWQALRRNTSAEMAQAQVLPQALFATSVAGAIVAILGGYMGMAMFNGALAALAGGFLLVTYIRYLRGDENAFRLPGGGALAFAWVAFAGVLVTAISAPKASSAALVATALTPALTPLAALYGPRMAHAPRALLPLITGLIAAVPALAGILIASLHFAG
ncbi:hypothetical protein NOF55_10755 [Rhizobiaceae bacterium BDR2-2]|uniref:Uncharacterized protein n=1 Tax=Ectorhizobium quercum TaxID=2965071 RepID=A0AAE3N030_9HYPH|nr:hypothetical protein [Ectorhizobium quercum]MCX8997586.1 hypothetical protein [Ectorhizobium quercum]